MKTAIFFGFVVFMVLGLAGCLEGEGTSPLPLPECILVHEKACKAFLECDDGTAKVIAVEDCMAESEEETPECYADADCDDEDPGTVDNCSPASECGHFFTLEVVYECFFVASFSHMDTEDKEWANMGRKIMWPIDWPVEFKVFCDGKEIPMSPSVEYDLYGYPACGDGYHLFKNGITPITVLSGARWTARTTCESAPTSQIE